MACDGSLACKSIQQDKQTSRHDPPAGPADRERRSSLGLTCTKFLASQARSLNPPEEHARHSIPALYAYKKRDIGRLGPRMVGRCNSEIKYFRCSISNWHHPLGWYYRLSDVFRLLCLARVGDAWIKHHGLKSSVSFLSFYTPATSFLLSSYTDYTEYTEYTKHATVRLLIRLVWRDECRSLFVFMNEGVRMINYESRIMTRAII